MSKRSDKSVKSKPARQSAPAKKGSASARDSRRPRKPRQPPCEKGKFPGYPIEQLGMTPAQARYAGALFASFAEGWDDPGMEAWDRLFEKLHGKPRR